MTFALILSLLLLLPSPGVAGHSDQLISMLGQDIKQSRSAEEKGTLYVYRARQYMKIKEWD
ncbi:MAG: hypothetical protein ABFR63_08495, partial [Thermodesulfobacteriota bacterium]